MQDINLFIKVCSELSEKEEDFDDVYEELKGRNELKYFLEKTIKGKGNLYFQYNTLDGEDGLYEYENVTKYELEQFLQIVESEIIILRNKLKSMITKYGYDYSLIDEYF